MAAPLRKATFQPRQKTLLLVKDSPPGTNTRRASPFAVKVCESARREQAAQMATRLTASESCGQNRCELLDNELRYALHFISLRFQPCVIAGCEDKTPAHEKCQLSCFVMNIGTISARYHDDDK
jgi:hypothetical protein